MKRLSDEIIAYEKMQDSLETDYFGKWVVIHNEKLHGTYETFENAAVDAVRNYGRGPYLIRQVGAAPVTPLPVFITNQEGQEDHKNTI